MAQVSVSISGRTYRMACDDGEEAHLASLAARLDAKITELRAHFGEIGDQRITVMAALTITDEFSEAQRRIASLEAELDGLRDSETSVDARVDAWSATLATTLDDAARRIEAAARRLDGPPAEPG